MNCQWKLRFQRVRVKARFQLFSVFRFFCILDAEISKMDIGHNYTQGQFRPDFGKLLFVLLDVEMSKMDFGDV